MAGWAMAGRAVGRGAGGLGRAARGLAGGGGAGPRALGYVENGPPEEVLRLGAAPAAARGAPGRGEVAVRMLMAPVNPADLNVVEGVYPMRPRPPEDGAAVPGGSEGVGVVEALGPGADDAGLAPGDWVLPAVPNLGTWSERLVCRPAELLKAPSDIPAEVAATLLVNPSTALRMLEDFVDLRPGDTVVQNGATSAVGQAVIQLCREMGVRTVNIVRDRPGALAEVARLKSLGATVVTTEKNARTDAAGLPPPRLGLNCVGGSAAQMVGRLLGRGATMVTYGAMSRRPVTMPTALLIFKDVTVRGFWFSGRWTQEHGRRGREEMLEQLLPLVRSGRLKLKPHLRVPLEEAETLFRNRGWEGDRKVLLTMKGGGGAGGA